MVGILDLPNSASKRIELPLKPMLGRVAVAPGRARKRSADSGRATSAATSTPRTSAKARPSTCRCSIHGALFYFGDGHALQGDGEIIGSGLETTMDVTFQFDLIKGKRIRWPRIEDDDHIMVAGSIRPLIDALRIAYVELIEWLVADYGFDKMDAFQVASQAGEVRVANVVDPNYTVVAKFPKRFLPPKPIAPYGEPFDSPNPVARSAQGRPPLRADAEHMIVGADEDLAVRDRRRRHGALAERVSATTCGARPALTTTVSPFSLTK